MTRRNLILIGLSVVLLTGGPLGLLGDANAEKALSFWNMPFVTQEVSPEYVSQWETDIKNAKYLLDNKNHYIDPGEGEKLNLIKKCDYFNLWEIQPK